MWTCQRWKKEEQRCLRCRRFSMTDACCNPGRTYRYGLVRTMAERYCHGLGTCVNKEIQQ